MLIAKGLSKKVGGKTILQDVSLSVRPGEIVCIVGPSGAGKTSLLRALSLLETPDSGSLTIGDASYHFPHQETEPLPPPPYPDVTVVFQQLFIWPHLTIRENMTLPLRGTIDQQHFDSIVALFQMSEFLDRYPNEVSVGQRQRAAIARALLMKPMHLLLDEITSALDIEQAHLILGHLKEIAGKGVSIVFVTHALHLAQKISDHVLFLDGGTIVESGSNTILQNPKTDRLRKFISAATLVS